MVNIVRNPQFEDGLDEWTHSPDVVARGPVRDPTVTGNFLEIPGGCFVAQEYEPPPVLGGLHRLFMRMHPFKSGRLWVEIRFAYADGTHTDIRYPEGLPPGLYPDDEEAGEFGPIKPIWGLHTLEAVEDQELTSIRITNYNTHENASIGIADLVLEVPD